METNKFDNIIIKVTSAFENCMKVLDNIEEDCSLEHCLALTKKVIEQHSEQRTNIEESAKKHSQKHDNADETAETTIECEATPSTRGRPRRKALINASAKINSQIQTPLNSKLRNDHAKTVVVKTEKINETVDMPPPRGRPKRTRKKGTAKKTDSLDVEFLPPAPAEVIDLSEKSDPLCENREVEDAEKPAAAPVVDEIEKQSDDLERTDLSEQKSTRSQSRKKKAVSKESVFEDAHESIPNAENDQINVTKVIHSNNVNVTMVLDSKPVASSTFVASNTFVVDNVVEDQLMTDDESIELEKPVPKAPAVNKPLFTTFENSPVKKKVAAFEKLANSQLPVPAPSSARVTRTKTRLNKEKAEVESAAVKPAPPPNDTKAKQKVVPKEVPSAKTLVQQKQDLKKREQFEEARKKKAALIQAQAEERKRQQEEKAKKVLQQREAMVRQKIEVLKERDRRREEVLQRHKEQQRKAEEEQKKLEQINHKQPAPQPAVFVKQNEEEERRRQLERQQKEKHRMAAERDVPLYNRMDAPPLPTLDCYDSDDENYQKPQKPLKCAWERRENLMRALNAQRFLPAFHDRLMHVEAPILQEIFPDIHPNKLIRRSSAIWREPARYTMMRSFMEEADATF